MLCANSVGLSLLARRSRADRERTMSEQHYSYVAASAEALEERQERQENALDAQGCMDSPKGLLKPSPGGLLCSLRAHWDRVVLADADDLPPQTPLYK